MKRIRDDSVIDLTSDSAPKKVRSDTTTHTPVCAICHKLLSDRCMECESFETTPNTRACQGTVHNAICGHTFHSECIARWLDVRQCCPLCNNDWLYPWGLNLLQLAAAKLVGNEMALVNAARVELPNNVISILDVGLSPIPHKNQLSPNMQHLLAVTFARYLTKGELESLLKDKEKRN